MGILGCILDVGPLRGSRSFSLSLDLDRQHSTNRLYHFLEFEALDRLEAPFKPLSLDRLHSIGVMGHYPYVKALGKLGPVSIRRGKVDIVPVRSNSRVLTCLQD